MRASKKTQKGFTLVELLVTITIFVLLTGVVLFNQSKFDSTILLTNLAYDTALTIRQAQTYGINIKEFDGNFKPYGVHFETGANNKSFILYADLSDNGGFTGEAGSCIEAEGCVSRYVIKKGNHISGLCVENDAGECRPVSVLDILFKRPNPDAVIYADGDSGYPKAKIFLGSANDGSNAKEVIVQSNGLIEIVN